MFSNPMQMIQAFNKFKSEYRGNPEQDVQNLLTSGRISQKQLNDLQKMANDFQQMFGNLV